MNNFVRLLKGDTRLFLIDDFKEELKNLQPNLLVSNNILELIAEVFYQLIGYYNGGIVAGLLLEIEEIPFLSIKNSRNFYRYFSLRILSTQISKTEFETEMKQNKDIIKSTIVKWLKDDKFTVDIVDKFHHHKPKTFNEYKNYITAYLYLINNLKFHEYSYNIDEEKIINQATKKIISSKFITNFSTTRLEAFLKNTLKNAEQPFYAERFIIQNIRTKLTQNANFYLTSEYLENILLEYFDKYVTQNKELNFHIFWGLFRASGVGEILSVGGQSQTRIINHSPLMKKEILRFAFNYPDAFTDLIIIPIWKKFGLDPAITEIFDSNKNFGKVFVYSDKLKPTRKIQELRVFYKKLDDNKFEPVNHKFNIIKVIESEDSRNLSKR